MARCRALATLPRRYVVLLAGLGRWARPRAGWASRWALVALLALPAGAYLAGPSGGEPALAAPSAATIPVQVGATGFNQFSPFSAAINVGDTVNWVWQGFMSHTTTSGQNSTPNGLWDSGFRSAPAEFPVTFNTPGTFPYYCQVHFGMAGEVVVSGGAPSPTATPTPTSTSTPGVGPSQTPTRTSTPGVAPSPTPTPTPPPGSTPTPTATATPAACLPRPPVSVTVAGSGRDRLLVTLGAGTGGPNAANRLQSLQFGAATNALIDVPGGPTGSSGNVTVPLPGGVLETTFFVRRVGAGTSGTVPLVVVDNCGGWSTFVGAGPNGWPAEPPPPVPTPLAVAAPADRFRPSMSQPAALVPPPASQPAALLPAPVGQPAALAPPPVSQPAVLLPRPASQPVGLLPPTAAQPVLPAPAPAWAVSGPTGRAPVGSVGAAPYVPWGLPAPGAYPLLPPRLVPWPLPGAPLPPPYWWWPWAEALPPADLPAEE